MTPAHRFQLVRNLLTRMVFQKDELALGGACRELDRLLAERGATGTSAREVSRNLRALGFTNSGMTGSGYDREPLYRRSAA